MAMHPAAKAAGRRDPGTRQILTFELGNETYGVEILSVREIRGWTPVTKIPQTPPHVLGVLNLRGSIVAVVDLRMRLALERAEYTKLTVIIVLSVDSPHGQQEIGVVVDAVSDVVDFDTAQMKQAPELGNPSATDYIRGLVQAGGRMVVLIDIGRLIDPQLADLAAGQSVPAAAVEAA
jgi:purine-binding chemotaxis protein CheW